MKEFKLKDFDIYKTVNHFQEYADVKSREIISNHVEDPYFTIMVPTYKRADTLRQAVQSAVDQRDMDGINYEILVVNNDPEGETGETRDVLESFSDDRIAYFVNEKNIGLCGNWNRCIELARGKYIVMLHDDDLLGPFFLWNVRYVIWAKGETVEPGVVGVGYQTFDSKSLPEFEDIFPVQYYDITKKGFFFGKNINIAGMTFLRELALEIGGFADYYYPNEDTIFIYQCLLRSTVVNVEDALAGYRIEVNASLKGDTMQQIILLTEKTRRCIAEHEPFARRFLRFFDSEFFYQYVDGANRHWSLDMDYEELCGLADVEYKEMNKYKFMLMRIIQHLERKYN